jgi:hypothetical protein
VLKVVSPDLGSPDPNAVLVHSTCTLHDQDHFVYPVEDDGSITYRLETIRSTRSINAVNTAQYLHPRDAVRLERMLGIRTDAVASAIRDALAEARLNGNLIRLSSLRRVEALVPANNWSNQVV